jgi:hypothetical protein
MFRLASVLIVCLLAVLAALVPVLPVTAAKISDVSNTKHNLSAGGPGTVKAPPGGESQICVFCHTPHGAESIPGAPLWNRKLSGAGSTYVPYSSSSIEANAAELSAGPGGSSKLCLSCHDGTMALGNVNVLNGSVNSTITLNGTDGGKMPAGSSGATSGFTRNLGVDFTNDHPISFTYDSTLATADGELRAPDGTTVGTRSPGVKPKLPLEAGKMQCSTCHDPHLRETDSTKGSAKFLRLNRFQESPPLGGNFSETGDIFCLACHNKGGQLWAVSAHANSSVATQVYGTSTISTLREFPTNLPVWKAACLNCHDTHAVQGARRLLREGTDSTAIPKTGGGSAIEETCYQCHSGAASLLTNVTSVPNIKDEFALSYRMPITTLDQTYGGGTEKHDIGTGTGTQRGKDFVESQALLANRHVECTDCHNPHRVTKKRLFNADASVIVSGEAGTHNHAAGHTNIASGVLRGITGVEPTSWTGVPFGNTATFVLKRGDGGNGTDPNPAASSAWVTREYQVCLKCHSSYAYGNTPPALGSSGGGTSSNRTGFNNYTDQGMEFQAPSLHKGAASTTDSGAFSGTVRLGCATPATACGGSCVCSSGTFNFQTRNHRSWHPVIGSTGRDLTARGIGTSPWRAPWTNSVGTQTMYCSDCHGSNTPGDTVDPNCTSAGQANCGDNGKPWGPHGSGNRFILKGEWSLGTGAAGRDGPETTNGLCFKCHNPTVYTQRNASGGGTGWSGGGKGNLHAYHTDRISKLRCSWCHIAVPHGWKNRSFLVNLNDVGPEVGLPAGTEVSISGSSSVYTNGPYYNNAKLKIRSFGTPGSWSDTNCGSATGQGGSGKSWMGSVCTSPP